MEEKTTPEVSEYKDRLSNFSREFDPGLFIYIFKKSVWYMLGLLFLCLLSALVYLKYTAPVYEAGSTLQIGQDNHATNVLKVTTSGDGGDLQSKVELLRSKLLIQETIGRLDTDVSYYAEGEILTNEHYTQSPYRIKLLNFENNEVLNKPINISFNQDSSYLLSFQGKKFGPYQPNASAGFEGMQFSLELVSAFNEEFLSNDHYFVLNSKQALVNRFFSDLDVRIVNSTANTVEISFKNTNRWLAHDFVYNHAQQFIAYDLKKHQESDENVLLFIDTQIDSVYNRLRQSEQSLNAYKQQNKISNLESLSGVYLERLTEFENEIINLEIEEALLNDVRELTSKEKEEISVYNLVPLVAGSEYEGSLRGLLESLEQLLQKREELLYQFTEDSETIKALDYQIGIQKAIIVDTIKALLDKVVARKTSLQRKLNEVESVYYKLPTKEVEFARLQRLFNINEKYYTMLLEKRVEYSISKEGYVPSNVILEKATMPQSPISPNQKATLASFLFLGVFFCFVYLLLKYFLHNKISSANDIVNQSSASIGTLGMLPFFKEKDSNDLLVVHKAPRSLLTESFRSIRTNLEFIDNSEGPSITAVTSTISGEGKTFICMNLAAVFAFTGKKTIVLDLDMRKPKVHKGMSVENRHGMSTLLSGKDKLEDCIHHSELDGLDFITAGPVPPNPSELIMSDRFTTLIEEIKQQYDCILLDTPPVGLVTDAVYLLKMANYPIYVFRADYSRKVFVHSADKLKNENKVNNLSAIINGLDLEGNRYRYSYGYGYNYGYGYGSGYYMNKEQ